MNHECHYGCGRPGITRDHVIPRSRQPERKNTGTVVRACSQCNGSRSSEEYPDFAERHGVNLTLIQETMVRAILEYERRFGGLAPLADRQSLRNFEHRHGLDEWVDYAATRSWHIPVSRSDKRTVPEPMPGVITPRKRTHTVKRSKHLKPSHDQGTYASWTIRMQAKKFMVVCEICRDAFPVTYHAEAKEIMQKHTCRMEGVA